MPGRAEVELGYGDTEVQTGLSRLEKRFGAFGRTISKNATGDFGRKFAAAGQAIVGAAAFTSFHRLAEHYDTIDRLATRFGTSSESMQRLEEMARMADMPVDTLVGGLTKLIRNLEEAESNPKIARALKTLGISASELRKASPEQQILMLAGALESAGARGQGFSEIFDLMGKSAGPLIDLLRQGRGELEKFADHHVVSDEDVKKLANFANLLKQGQITMKSWTASTVGGLTEFLAVAARAAENMLFNQGTTFGADIEEALQAAGDALADTEAEADAKERAAAAAREKAEADQQAAEIGALEAQRDKAAEEAAESAMDDAEKLAAVREKIAKINSDMDSAVGNKKLELELEIQKLGLMEKEAALEKAGRQRASSVQDFAAEMQILQARAHGQQRYATEMEKELAIKKEAQQLARALGIDERQAMDLARQKAGLEEKVQKKQSGKITGFHKAPDAKWSGLDWVAAHGGGRGMLKESWQFPGLDRHRALNEGQPGARNLIPFGHAFDRASPTIKLPGAENSESLLNRIAEAVEGISAY